MEKQIGIITYHRSHNYGAVLQAYSLKTYLEKLGFKVEIIDYWPDYRKGMYDLIDISFLKDNISVVKKLKRLFRLFLVFPKKLLRFKNFEIFIRDELNINDDKTIKNGSDIQNKYDFIVFGSDQIWRYNNFDAFKGFDAVYWGKYPQSSKVKKIAYAASMGIMEIDSIQSIFIEENISNFDFVSVREKELAKTIQLYSTQKVEHVLDPVFLLKPKEWLSLTKLHDRKDKEYILLYNLNLSKEALGLSRKIAKKYNYRLIELSGWVRPFANSYRQKQTISPIGFISLFANASFVVSTSFHGVAFSIIFKKQFYALGMANNSQRVTSLLKELNIVERYVTECDKVNVSCQIDYSKVNTVLEGLRSDSIELLLNNLKFG